MIAQNRQNEFTAPNQDYYDDFIKASVLGKIERWAHNQSGAKAPEGDRLTSLRRRRLRESA